MANPYRRLLLWLGARRSVAAAAARLQPGIDRALMRIGRGRISTVASMPALLLTSTGRRSGREHTVPLFHVPAGSGWAVVDTSYGRSARPAWSLNLEADASCTVRVDGKDRASAARRAAGEEFEASWRDLLDVWPLYADYATRSGRTPIVWILVPEAG